MNKELNKEIKKIRKIAKKNVCALAYSGGRDSKILLKILKGIKIKIIHVNHNINKESKKWEKICKKDIRKQKQKIKILNINICKKKIKKKGLEEAAREKRYKKMFCYLKKKKIKNLLTAHNLNDKIETYFLNIFRGCGIKGNISIKKKTKRLGIKIIRPLINISREKLIKKIKIKNFLIDKSNKDLNFRRNIIRLILEKEINFFFPNYKELILKNIYILKEYKKIVDLIAKKDIKNTSFKIKKLNKKKTYRVKNIIRYYLEKKNIKISSINWIKEIIKQIKSKSKKMIIKNNNVNIFIKNKTLIFKKI